MIIKFALFTHPSLSFLSLSTCLALVQGTSSCTSRITCRRPARYAPSRCGNCSSRRRRTNARGKQCKTKTTTTTNRKRKDLNTEHWTLHSTPYRCRNKIHKEHVDKNDLLAPCKLNHDPRSARDMLLLAMSPEEQSLWVARLLKRIQKSGYKANSSSNNNSSDAGSKISPR